MSTLKCSNLQNASAASPAIVLDANSCATLNGLSYPTEGSLSGRNRLINADCRIDQRNAGASFTPVDNTYGLDRYKYSLSQASKLTAQQSSTAPTGFGFSYLHTVGAAANVTVGSGDIFAFSQPIEGFNTVDLAFGTASAVKITLSFWVRSSVTGTFSVAFLNGASDRSYVATYTISAANTWEQKTISITGDTSGTWVGATNGTGLRVYFDLGAGSTYTTSAGSWQAGAFTHATGSTNLVATNGATFYITGVQLEAGSVATPFERRSYGQELALCQRYFEKNTITTTAVTLGSGSRCAPWYYKASKRSGPTITYSSVTAFTSGGGAISSPTAVDLDSNSDYLYWAISNSSTAVQATATITASAEL